LKHWAARAAAVVAALLLFSAGLRSQSSEIVDVSGADSPTSQSAKPPKLPFWSQTAGQGTVAFEGYYLSASGQPTISTSGVNLGLKEYLPGIGVLDTAVEGSFGDGFHTGTMFVALEQVPIFGWHWDFVGGDSEISSNLLGNTVNNISTPDISARGFNVTMRRKTRAYQVFFGNETLVGGERIAYRVQLPQRVAGVTMKQSIGERLDLGVRFLYLDTNSSVLTSESTYFLPGHVFRTSGSLAVQGSYTLSKHMKFFGETNYTRATQFVPSLAAQRPLSFFGGWAWEKDKFSVKANYVSQGVTYLPLLGSFSGDRRGPFMEGHYQVLRRLEVTGSGQEDSNNLEHNPLLPTFHSSGFSAGGSYILPWAVNFDASISTLQLTTANPAEAPFASNNRQISMDVSRGFRRHSVRFSYIAMKMNDNSALQSEHFTEGQDTFSWKHIVLRGAVRFQNSQTTDTRNTIYLRGAVQTNLKWISAYVNFEKGNDLVNQSVFSTSAYSDTVIGFNIPLRRGWNLQAEASRNNLNTILNPENVFLFPTANLGATQVPGFQQWSGYFRFGRSFRWGKTLSSSIGIDQFAAARVPLVGSIQGRVTEQALAGVLPSANVSVSLDSSRSVVTDSSGNYTFNDVAEGPHVVGLDPNQLPTDYEPGPNASVQLVVTPRQRLHSDFTVVRLVRLTGTITSPPEARLENMVIRLEGTDRYTTPDEDGDFGFYNLKEGQYTIAIDPSSIPDELMLSTPGSLQILASRDNAAAETLAFALVVKPPPVKPVRNVLQQQIHVGSAPKPAPNATPAPSSRDTHKPKKNAGGGTAPPTPNKN
jgi:hypothetical protein